jgi:hypothetical protein
MKPRSSLKYGSTQILLQIFVLRSMILSYLPGERGGLCCFQRAVIPESTTGNANS